MISLSSTLCKRAGDQGEEQLTAPMLHNKAKYLSDLVIVLVRKEFSYASEAHQQAQGRACV